MLKVAAESRAQAARIARMRLFVEIKNGALR
jgi:hypothetical protein